MQELLRSAIHAHLREINYDSKLKQPIVTEEVLENMVDNLITFVHNSSLKFLNGQKEHGGDIRDRDLWNEFQQEQYDSYWYIQALSWPKKP